MVAEYLDKNYDRVRSLPQSFYLSHLFYSQFFASFTTLIQSQNYVTKRQSLKLLGEILLDRANFNVMTRYIANETNLKMMMNLLRDKSKNIQFEAFHVFKVKLRGPIYILNSLGSLADGSGHAGVCRQPEEAPSNRDDSSEKQG